MQIKPMVMKQQGFTIIELVVVILLLGILAATALPRFIDVTTEAHNSVFEATVGGLNTGAALYRAEWTARGQPASNTPLQSYGGLRAAPTFEEGTYLLDADGAGPNDESSFTVGTFGGRSAGYPFALRDDVVFTSGAALAADYSASDCAAVFENILQDIGAPTVAVANLTTDGVFSDFSDAADIRTDVATAQAATAADFQAFVQSIEFDTGFARAGAELVSPGPANYSDTAPACVYVYSAEAENFERSVLYVPWTGRVSVYTSLDDLIEGATYDGPVVP